MERTEHSVSAPLLPSHGGSGAQGEAPHQRLLHPLLSSLCVDFCPAGGIRARAMERKHTNKSIVLEVVPFTQILQVAGLV